MDFRPTARAQELLERLDAFLTERLDPVEPAILRELDAQAPGAFAVPPAMRELQSAARDAGLWNLFLPEPADVPGVPETLAGPGLANAEYAILAERLGRSAIASEVCNCNAPDTGNMEVLLQFGTPEQQERWLAPLLRGEIRSAFCMTEPDVASSDATNMQATARIEGDEVVLDGEKWWSTGVGHPDCEVLIFMGLTDPDAHRYGQHSMVLVPRDAPGVTVERLLPTMGFLDAPGGHGRVRFDGVRVPVDHVIGTPGGAFGIAQARLGPGRVHHCMRLIGLAELALELACRRATTRVAFGKPLANLGGNRERIADARMKIDQARLLVLHAAWLLDTEGLAGALGAVSQIKVVVPNMAQEVIDMAIQLHGGAGLSDETPLAGAWTMARALRLADGPDEVHRGVIARLELAAYKAQAAA
ncbi:acyl-CoA dehydrogenase family protein [Patulibacter brassicae]|uniref:Acyl-CoA dehydrogenase family protein n=1 Tax=Patulibacter brassicae TaxID=1705717 RepID=A0ABU4VIE5_9ACTN|nr:acyl-CoA dehydrogenase family protein [Patulibacter brassicae]MDX8151611.1 acyl-CoA dehydrogenase family protein [Patulibacter brassicae]